MGGETNSEVITGGGQLSKLFRRFLLSVTNTLRAALASLFGLVLNFVLLHYKSTPLLNVYVYCTTAAALLQVLCSWGSKDFVTKELSENPASSKEFIGNVLMSRFILLVILTPVLFLLQSKLQHVVVVLALLLLRSLGAVFESLVILRRKFHSSLLIDTIINVLFIIVLLLDENNVDINIFLAQWMITEALRFGIFAAYFRSDLSLRIDIPSALSILKRSTPFFFVALAGFCCSRADLYILGLTMAPSELSGYYILLNMVILCQVFYTSFNSAFAASIFRYNEKTFQKFESYSLKMGLLFAVMSTAGVYLLAYLFFHIRLSTLFTSLVLINLFAFTVIFTSVYYFTRLNRQNVILRIIISGGILNIILSPFLIRYFGMSGAFAGNTVCAVFSALLFRFVQGRFSKPVAG